MNIFESAVRNKFRFNFKGIIGVEDLFDLNVVSLDSIFKDLNSQLKQSNEESLLEIKTKHDQEIDTKIEIIKYVVQLKLDEQQERLVMKDKKEQKQKLMALLAEKEEDSLKLMSKEELQKMLTELE